MTHSVAVNLYPATARMPQLTIVVVDTIPIELKRSYICNHGTSRWDQISLPFLS